jgi:cobyrinic acid a,c-diamide synthase
MKKTLTEQDVLTLTEVMNGLTVKHLGVSTRLSYAESIRTVLTPEEAMPKQPSKVQQIHNMYLQDQSNTKLLYRVIKYLNIKTIAYAYERAYELKYCKECKDLNKAAKEFNTAYQELKKSGYLWFKGDNTLMVK